MLPILLQRYWRGPFVAINAGPLTSRSPLPAGCSPWLVTCGRDYFCTRDPARVRQEYAQLAATDGTHVHLACDAHMPDLSSTQARRELLGDLCEHIVAAVPPPRTMLGGAAVVAPLPKPRVKSTVRQSRPRVTHTVLRSSPTSAADWAPEPNVVRDGETVEHLEGSRDAKGYLMFRVRSQDGATGWVYAKNLDAIA